MADDSNGAGDNGTAERKTFLGNDWHSSCLRCEKCNKTLTPGSHAEHEGKPYCNHPCYSALFGPGVMSRGEETREEEKEEEEEEEEEKEKDNGNDDGDNGGWDG
ncbi:hypothetical protein HZH66_000207 [Vespula vulgaris]|uniref:Cysteine-rich protein 1 n=1 Tax=Vespula vulgaris TaxID=7454 RepID=A0A834KSU6_VESVU|nr:hypothetical protein HZH66_000207 [Vespula vulgaris]